MVATSLFEPPCTKLEPMHLSFYLLHHCMCTQHLYWTWTGVLASIFCYGELDAPDEAAFALLNCVVFSLGLFTSVSRRSSALLSSLLQKQPRLSLSPAACSICCSF